MASIVMLYGNSGNLLECLVNTEGLPPRFSVGFIHGTRCTEMSLRAGDIELLEMTFGDDSVVAVGNVDGVDFDNEVHDVEDNADLREVNATIDAAIQYAISRYEEEVSSVREQQTPLATPSLFSRGREETRDIDALFAAFGGDPRPTPDSLEIRDINRAPLPTPKQADTPRSSAKVTVPSPARRAVLLPAHVAAPKATNHRAGVVQARSSRREGLLPRKGKPKKKDK